jgi:hypothetical protein
LESSNLSDPHSVDVVEQRSQDLGGGNIGRTGLLQDLALGGEWQLADEDLLKEGLVTELLTNAFQPAKDSDGISVELLQIRGTGCRRMEGDEVLG